MEMSGEHRIPAPRQAVWEALNDPDVLKQCIPGCESLEKLSDTEMKGQVRAKVGPVSAKFAGMVTLSNVTPPEGYTIQGEGKGGAAGFAKGGADVKLAEDGDDTILTYQANAQVGGKLAQIGSRLVKGTAEKMAGDFFSRFATLVAERQSGAAAPQEEPSAAARAPTPPSGEPEAAVTAGETASGPDRSSAGGLSPIAWIGILVVIAALVVWVFAG